MVEPVDSQSARSKYRLLPKQKDRVDHDHDSNKTKSKSFTRSNRHPKNQNPLGFHARNIPWSLQIDEEDKENSTKHREQKPSQTSGRKALKPIEKLGRTRIFQLLTDARQAIVQAVQPIHPHVDGILQLFISKESAAQKPKNNPSNSSIINEVVKSYHSASSGPEKERLLSILISEFSRKELGNLIGENVTWYRYRNAHLHALHWGAGASSESPMFKHLKYCRSEIEKVVNFCLDQQHVQAFAHGDKQVINSTGDIINLGNFTRVYNVETLWKKFDRHQKPMTVRQISRTTFFDILTLATGDQQKKNGSTGR